MFYQWECDLTVGRATHRKMAFLAMTPSVGPQAGGVPSYSQRKPTVSQAWATVVLLTWLTPYIKENVLIY